MTSGISKGFGTSEAAFDTSSISFGYFPAFTELVFLSSLVLETLMFEDDL